MASGVGVSARSFFAGSAQASSAKSKMAFVLWFCLEGGPSSLCFPFPSPSPFFPSPRTWVLIASA
eukprot:3659498-Prorocentrum_lima.AAC.1